MYGDAEPFEIYPIGTVKNELRRSDRDFGVVGKGTVSRIELIPSQKPFLYRLEEENWITVVYYLHKSRQVWSVFKRRVDKKRVGVFASRTPHRLSRIAIQDVRLISVEGTTLFVEGLDAIDGSPVLDIKLKKTST
jgi:tRNA (Thr-GGU) A37 N-methylase